MPSKNQIKLDHCVKRKIFAKLIRIFSVFILLSCCYAQQAYGLNNKKHQHIKEETWYLNPLGLQLTGQGGLIAPIDLFNIDNPGKDNEGPTTNQEKKTKLWTLGGSLDVNLFYIRNFFFKYFDNFPKLGLLLKYDTVLGHHLDYTSYLMGSVLYLEPNFHYTNGMELLSRFGVGVAYLNIIGAFSAVKPENEEEALTVPDQVQPFREGVSLDLIFDFLLKYRITPHWDATFNAGLDWLPDFFSNSNIINKSFFIYKLGLGCNYTFNPFENTDFTRNIGGRKNRVDLSWLSTFRKAHYYSQRGSIEQSSANHEDVASLDKNTFNKNAYYYIGGLHVQFSVQIADGNAFIIGSEFVKDFALAKELEKAVIKDNLQIGTMIGHEFLWNKLNFSQCFGIYLLNVPVVPTPIPFLGLFYTRFIANFRITDHLSIGSSLKIEILPRPIPDDNGKVPHLKKDELEWARISNIDFRITYVF